MFYQYLIRPYFKEKRVSFVGLTLIGAVISYVLDVTVDYHGYWMAWNKHSLNMGVWSQFFPFHTGPTQYAEAMVWGVPMYCYFGLLMGSIQLFIINKVQKKFKTSLLVAVLYSMIGAFIFDLVVEWGIIYFTEAYAWGLTTKIFTLLPGSQFQFPIYESIAVAFYGTIYALLMKSERENGIAYPEKGLNGVPIKTRGLIRLFAAIGFAFIPTIVYFGTFNIFSIWADSYANLPIYLQYIK